MTDFVPYSLIVPDDRPTGRLALVLHGILGTHKNWRSFARSLADALPGWRFALVDLRNHGDSMDAPGPHTLASCADDLERLAALLDAPIEVIVGHSFGGKVALEMARRRPPGLDAVYVLDATPQAFTQLPSEDHEVRAVFAALRRVPQPLARRSDVVGHLAAQGMSESIRAWMTTNLRHTPAGYVWTFDLDAAEQLLFDYFRTDLWAPLQTTDPSAPRVELVRAGRSDRWDDAVVATLEALPRAARGRVHLLADAGHWVHVDDPQGLTDLLRATWPS